MRRAPPPLAHRDEDQPGSSPLKNPEHEKLAREHAAGASMAEAWRAVGRDPALGNQSRTFRRPNIQARVEYLRGEFNRMAGISLAALQARLLRIADANVVSYFEADEHGRLRLRDLTALPSAVTAPIAELRVEADGAVKLKTADKLHAIDSLLKTVNGFAPEDTVNVAVSLETLIAQSMLPPEERDQRYGAASNLSARRTSTEATAERETAAPAKRFYRRGGR
jgi:hypothetical protein